MLISYLKSDIEVMEQRFRTNLINSIAGFKSTNLIGTINHERKTNLAIFNSVFHVGAHPPLLGIVCRPHEVERHTLENILSEKHYTINHIHPNILTASHQTSARYPRDISEFDACALTEQYSNTVKAPYVKESRVKMGLELREKIDVRINGTVIIIGEILEIMLEQNIIHKDGFAELEAVETITVCGLDAYYKTSLLSRLPYAKAK